MFRKLLINLILMLCLFFSFACNSNKNEKVMNSSVYPQIISTIPTVNATNVPPNIIISISYNTCCTIEQIKPIILTINNLETTSSYTDNTAHFKPSGSLEYNKSYTVIVTDALNRDFSFQFTTSDGTLPDFPDLPGN